MIKTRRRAKPALEDAIALAARAHRGQRDKGGSHYIQHPLRLMLRVSGEREKMTAVLHDVVEDCGISLKKLAGLGYPRAVVRAVAALTRREAESYESFVLRAKRDPIARRVKLADIDDNMDLSRLPHPGPKDLERLKRYRKARRVLLA